jgi:hypothetical protein
MTGTGTVLSKCVGRIVRVAKSCGGVAWPAVFGNVSRSYDQLVPLRAMV